MKIIEPSATLLTPENGIESLRFIERMARISHKSENRQTDDSWEPFIRAVVLGHGDWSVTEHISATVLFRVDRGITHELVRHRLFSYTQESTRFVNGSKSYPDGLEFIKPQEIPAPELISDRRWFSFERAIQFAENRYLDLLDQGARPQEARSVLPNALASTIAMTGNLRNWRWFFLARTTLESHPDMRRVTIPLLKQFQERIPLLYSDIEPLQKQSVSMAKIH
jgi:thymidylate synthase (FAD)